MHLRTANHTPAFLILFRWQAEMSAEGAYLGFTGGDHLNARISISSTMLRLSALEPGILFQL